MIGPAPLDDPQSDSTGRQLVALRAALESRLTALEEALADPSRGESLESLILDLSRVATEEAQTAASAACLDTRLEADRQIADARASAQAALESARATLHSAAEALAEERAASSDLRLAIELAQQKILTLEREQAETRAARDALVTEVARERNAAASVLAELAREREAAVALQRALAETHSQLDAERASNAELRRMADRAEEQLAAVDRDASQGLAARDELASELARERETAAAVQGMLAETQSQLEAERASSARLRSTADRAKEQLAAAAREASQGLTARDQLATELTREGEAVATLRRALAETQSQLDAERASSVDLRSAVEYADQRLSTLLSDNARALANHEQMAAELARERAGAAEATTAMVDAQRERASARADAQALGAEVEAIRMRLEGLTTERDTLAGELQFAQRILDAQREADLALLSVGAAPPFEEAHAPTPQAKSAAGAVALPGDDEGWQPVRLANRYVFHEDIEIQVNGDPGRLFDLSASGCQLLSAAALKLNATVRVVLPSDQTSIACMGKIVWARLEPASGGRPLGYRAGVRFIKADESAIEAFAVRRGATA